jgi:hypothetical protein
MSLSAPVSMSVSLSMSKSMAMRVSCCAPCTVYINFHSYVRIFPCLLYFKASRGNDDYQRLCIARKITDNIKSLMLSTDNFHRVQPEDGRQRITYSTVQRFFPPLNGSNKKKLLVESNLPTCVCVSQTESTNLMFGTWQERKNCLEDSRNIWLKTMVNSNRFQLHQVLPYAVGEREL